MEKDKPKLGQETPPNFVETRRVIMPCGDIYQEFQQVKLFKPKERRSNETNQLPKR